MMFIVGSCMRIRSIPNDVVTKGENRTIGFDCLSGGSVFVIFQSIQY